MVSARPIYMPKCGTRDQAILLYQRYYNRSNNSVSGELNKESRMNMIRTKVLVHLTYPAIPLHLASKTQMLKLQAVQNDAFKFVHKVDHTHTE